MNDPMGGWILPASMFCLMFGMGLALVPDDFRRVVRVPGPVVAGTLLQLVGIPLIGFALALLYELPPMLAVGLVIVAACPGGMLSNLLVHLTRANTALSITLTATATTVTLLTLPLWIRATLAIAGGDARTVHIPLLGTAAELAGLTVLPVALGMILHRLHPPASRLERPLSLIATVGILGSLAYDGYRRPDPPTEQFVASLLPALWLSLSAALLGLVVPLSLRQPVSDAVTVAVELCLKNGLLGMVVASRSFGILEPSIPIVVYSGFMMPISALILVVHRIREVRRARRFREASA